MLLYSKGRDPTHMNFRDIIVIWHPSSFSYIQRGKTPTLAIRRKNLYPRWQVFLNKTENWVKIGLLGAAEPVWWYQGRPTPLGEAFLKNINKIDLHIWWWKKIYIIQAGKAKKIDSTQNQICRKIISILLVDISTHTTRSCSAAW